MKPDSERALTLLRLALAAMSLTFLMAAPGALERRVLAQGSAWSEPALVFEGDGNIRLPTMVADKYGQVHAFWYYQPPNSGINQEVIFYTRLDQVNVLPVDILTARAQGLASAAGAGGLMLSWQGAFYATAGPSPRISAKDWSAPDQLAVAYFNGGLAAAPDDALWLIYGVQESNAVFVQRMDPQTQFWDDALLVANASNPGAAPDELRLAVGPNNSLHAVWAEFELPQGWPPLGLYYADSLDGGQTWTLPRRFAEELHNQPSVLAGPEDRIYVAWVGAAGRGGKFFQESPDNGRTWEPVVEIVPPPVGGSEGFPVLALDGAGNLHIVYSHEGCVWHVSREAETWAAPECISGAPAHIEEPAMTIGLGNQIHVMYWSNSQQLWYVTRTLNAPAQEPLPLPTEPPPVPTTVRPTATVMPTPTRPPQFGPPPEPGQADQASLWALAAGAAPVALLLAVVIAQRAMRRR